MKISYEYIRGLIDGEGCFTFCTAPNPKIGKVRIPAFMLRMNIRDKNLIIKVRDSLRLKNKIYIYHYPGDSVKRQPEAVLIVRDFGSLKNIVIPLFYKKLHGYKRLQFIQWIEKMASDPLVPRNYRLFPKLYNNGYFEDWSKKFQ